MKKHGFTLVEVLISCGILAVFMTGVLTLYTHGSKVGNTTMWLQNTTNKLKLTTRQINMSITKSSYPSVIAFPDGITEYKNFKLWYKESLGAKEAGEGTNFLEVMEAKPAKTGFGENKDEKAKILYHEYSLNKKGDLIFTLYEDTDVEAKEISDSFTISKTKIRNKVTLVKDVESIKCNKMENARSDSPLEITITCHMPNANTVREEKAIGVPNVEVSVY